MKKTLAVLAVLMVAAAAQAELLSSWTITSDGGNTAQQDYNDHLAFGDLTVTGGLQSTYNSKGPAGEWRLNTWTTGQLDADFVLEDGYTFALTSITSSLNGGGNPAAAEFAWYDGTTPVTSPAGFTASKTPTAVTWTQTGDPSWTANGDDLVGTLSLKATGATTGSGAVGAASWTSIENVSLYGTVTGGDTPTPPTPQVPEPATMGLLGLGALAMALRRKLRK